MTRNTTHRIRRYHEARERHATATAAWHALPPNTHPARIGRLRANARRHAQYVQELADAIRDLDGIDPDTLH